MILLAEFAIEKGEVLFASDEISFAEKKIQVIVKDKLQL